MTKEEYIRLNELELTSFKDMTPAMWDEYRQLADEFYNFDEKDLEDGKNIA